MARVLHIELLLKAARKMKLTAMDVSDAGDKSKLFISNESLCYVAHDDYLYPDVSMWQRRLMANKILTQQVLTKLKYKTIKSFDFSPRDYDTASALVKAVKKCPVKYPAITKINSGTYGLGIVFLSNEKELIKSVTELHSEKKRFMIQPVHWHDEYRITFIGGKPIMVHKKRLPQITGDGRSTVASLLEKQPTELKDQNFIAWNLAKHKLTPKSILDENQFLATHIIKKRTPDYYKVTNFPTEVVAWGKQLLTDLSIKTCAIDFMAPKGLEHPDQFIIFELNSNPHWTYVIDELNDRDTPVNICQHILTSYFGRSTKR